jgi:hypothetical protein
MTKRNHSFVGGGLTGLNFAVSRRFRDYLAVRRNDKPLMAEINDYVAVF